MIHPIKRPRQSTAVSPTNAKNPLDNFSDDVNPAGLAARAQIWLKSRLGQLRVDLQFFRRRVD